jgi:WhiB family redox-sensing transcriptional regulator
VLTLDEWLVTVREPWMRDALCNEYPKALFFPERGEDVEPAKAVCGRCAVTAECLAYALADPDAFVFGIWGGTSGNERRKLGRAVASVDDALVAAL